MDYRIPVLLLGAVILASGCLGESPPSDMEYDAATLECIRLCQDALGRGEDLSSGPCLSNDVQGRFVCDVAHSPRDPFTDNDPANQCPAYGNTVQHFIEVEPDCSFIRAV
jgi:hypothetical protein